LEIQYENKVQAFPILKFYEQPSKLHKKYSLPKGEAGRSIQLHRLRLFAREKQEVHIALQRQKKR